MSRNKRETKKKIDEHFYELVKKTSVSWKLDYFHCVMKTQHSR